jgi:hypothetical protein
MKRLIQLVVKYTGERDNRRTYPMAALCVREIELRSNSQGQCA